MNIVDKIPDDRLEFRKLIVSRIDDNILHVFIKPDVILELKDLQPVIEYVQSLGDRAYYNIFEFAKYSSTDNDVRSWASDINGNTRTIADAIVIGGLDQKIIADAYMNVNKPVKPTALFSNNSEAFEWINSLKKQG